MSSAPPPSGRSAGSRLRRRRGACEAASFFSPTAPISPICRTPLFPYLTFYSCFFARPPATSSYFRQSPWDTTVFFLQTRAAARVVSEELLAQIEMALASCTPPDAELEKVKIPNTSFFPYLATPFLPYVRVHVCFCRLARR